MLIQIERMLFGEKLKTRTEYIIQCKFPEFDTWANVIYELEDEDSAQRALDSMVNSDDPEDAGYDGCKFRIVKSTFTSYVIDEKLREKQS